MNYHDRAKDYAVAPIAERLGLEVVQRGASIAFGPCPACSSERRHADRRDKRLACGMKRPFVGFKCHECDFSGDALTLVNVAVGGARKFSELGSDGRDRVKRWWADYFGDAPYTPTARERQPQPEPEPNYPPPDAVRAIWSACGRMDEDEQARAFCSDKGIDATKAADLDLCRVLPKAGVTTGDDASDESIRIWLRNEMRAVFPLYDARGELRSLKARSVLPKSQRKNPTPSYPLKGYDKAGLVTMCALAKQVLAACKLPDWWPADVDPWVEIVEGEAKLAIVATAYGDLQETAPMVIGIESGVRFDRLFARLPERVRILIATDPNPAGAAYASKALEAMSPAQRAKALLAEWFDVAAVSGAAKAVVR